MDDAALVHCADDAWPGAGGRLQIGTAENEAKLALGFELPIDFQLPTARGLGAVEIIDAAVGRPGVRLVARRLGEDGDEGELKSYTHPAELAREGFPINLIQAQLGHSSLATTSRYLAHIAPQQLVDAIQKREWRSS